MDDNAIFCPYLRMMAFETSDPAIQAMPQQPRILLDYELFQLRAGRGRTIIDGRSYDLAPGSLFLVQPGLQHYHEFMTRCEFYYVHFDLYYAAHRESTYVVPWSSRFNEDDRHLMQASIDVPYAVNAEPSSLSSFKELLEIYQEAGPLWQLRAQGLLLRLLDGFLSGESGTAPATSIEQRLQRAVLFMRSHIHQHLSLADIAAAAHLSEFYFLRTFKKHYQATPSQYHMRLRLEEAAFRLQHSHDSIQEIANELGFKTPFHFSRCFKVQFGASPRAFRSIRD